MSIGFDHTKCSRQTALFTRGVAALKREARGVFDDLGTLLLAGLVLAGLVIVASTFDGDLQGKDEIVAAILGTLSLFAILASLELADRMRSKRGR